MKLLAMLRRFLGDRSGATAVEYALITALISSAIIGSLQQIAPVLSDTFTAVKEGFSN